MKKSFVNLLCCCMAMISLVACDEPMDGGLVPIYLEIRICDTDNVDLLDSQNEEALWNADWEVIWNGKTCSVVAENMHSDASGVIQLQLSGEGVPAQLVFPLIKWNTFGEAQGNIVISWNGGEETTEIAYDVRRLEGSPFSESYTVNGQPIEPSPYECMLSIVKE